MKNATFLIGLPAAGKTTIARETFPGMLTLDCDSIKASHPDYNPKNPAPLHAWSKEVLRGQFETTLAGTESFIYDSTGTDWQSMAANMTAAKLAGFRTTLFFVTCTMAESIRRNSLRSRVVPAHIIETKAETVAASFDILKNIADTVTVTDNSKPR